VNAATAGAAATHDGGAVEAAAELTRPGDQIRRGHRVYQVETVSVTGDVPHAISMTVVRMTGTVAAVLVETLLFPGAELIRRIGA
jgi:hypothetical protein